jgi:6,7-dimethyl-8-ribityllumazine synthase
MRVTPPTWDSISAVVILAEPLLHEPPETPTSPDPMPREIPIAAFDAADRFGIVVAQWNRAVTDKLLDGATAALQEALVPSDRVDVAWVPGSWEIPLAAKRMADSGRYAAVICLGAVIRGETTHDQHINRGVTLALMDIALGCDLPVLLGLLTCETLEQALARAGGSHGNKGRECAEAALYMAGLLKNLPPA